MSNQEIISQLLQSLSIPTTPFSPWVPNAVTATATHVGLQVELQIHFEKNLIAQILIGFLPKENIAPLLRYLLDQNSMFIGVYFCVLSNTGIVIRASRGIEGLDALELKLLLDGLCSTYWQHAQNLQQKFQLPLTLT